MSFPVSFPAIASLVPHFGNMLLLDRVISADHEKLCAQVAINADTLFCDGQQVGAWVGIEYMAQAIAAHAGYLAGLRGDPVKVGFLLGTRRYECSQSGFALGSILHVHVQRALQGENGLGAFECRIVLANSLANAAGNEESETAALAVATITVYQPENLTAFLQGSAE